MKDPETSAKPGPKPLPSEVWNQGVDMALAGAPVREISRRLGIGMTKAYEIRRNPIKRNAPGAEPPGGKDRPHVSGQDQCTRGEK